MASSSAAAALTSPLARDATVQERSVPAGKLRLDPSKYAVKARSYEGSSLGDEIIIQPLHDHTATVFVLHGLGDTAAGWLPAVLDSYLPGLPHAKFVVPTAPTRPITLNFGMPMPGWYDIKTLDKDRASQDCDGLDDSRHHLEWLIQAELDAGIPLDRIVVTGFSQGGALSLSTGLQYRDRLAGICVMSGYLPGAANVRVTEAAKTTPVHFFHGDADEVVRLDWGQASRDKIKELGCADVDFKQYHGLPHSANEEELTDVTAWLKAKLPAVQSG